MKTDHIHFINQFNQLVSSRRTIKPEHYNGKTVDDSIVKQILANANWAPTHKYTEPWRFIVFSGKGKQRFSLDHANIYKEETPSDLFKQAKQDKIIRNGQNASHIIAITMQRDDRIPEIEEIEAVACAVQNMWLTASAYGVASYWYTGGMTYHDRMKEYLGVNGDNKVLGFFFLGLSDKKKPQGKRVSGIEEKTTWISE